MNTFSNADAAYKYICEQALGGEPRLGGGVETRAKFGVSIRLDTGEDFPVITTKKVSWKNVIIEALWFLSASRKVSLLHKHGVHFWDPWADADGNIACSYGTFWRRWDSSCSDPQRGCGQAIDQISENLRLLERQPDTRRAIVSAWAPHMFATNQLVPCHSLFHLEVNGGRFDLSLYQRSADVAIGAPYNLSSYCLLQQLFANHLGLSRGVFNYSIGDCHVYSGGEYNHIPSLEEQLTRKPLPPPKLQLQPFSEIREPAFYERYLTNRSTEQILEDYKLVNYASHPSVSYKVVVT